MAPTTPTTKRRRKNTPTRAPTKTKTTPASPQIQASLLLLALLREGRKGPLNLNNNRFPSPSSSRFAPTPLEHKVKRQRDQLPPVDVSYGRGKRSASAAASNNNHANGGSIDTEAAGRAIERPLSPDVGHGSTRSSSTTRKPKPTPFNSLDGPSSRRLKRSASIEPISSGNGYDPNFLSPVGGLNSRGMARASSVGVGIHRDHGHDEHVPSPLARSFSIGDSGETGHARAVSSGSTGLRERESRKLDVPHHLQGFELATNYVS